MYMYVCYVEKHWSISSGAERKGILYYEKMATIPKMMREK